MPRVYPKEGKVWFAKSFFFLMFSVASVSELWLTHVNQSWLGHGNGIFKSAYQLFFAEEGIYIFIKNIKDNLASFSLESSPR